MVKCKYCKRSKKNSLHILNYDGRCTVISDRLPQKKVYCTSSSSEYYISSDYAKDSIKVYKRYMYRPPADGVQLRLCAEQTTSRP